MSDGLNKNSHHITDGDERAPNRSMLRAVGFRDQDFGKPIVGVASAQSDITPCNAGLGDLAQQAARGIRESCQIKLLSPLNRAFTIETTWSTVY